jgi:GT2 family glycosyltransferase
VLGASLFVRRESIEAVGKLSEDYFFFLEETDLCWRIRSAGWQVLYVPDAQVVHVSGASSKQRDRADTRIEYNRSLDHFLKTHRGAHSARAVRIVRLLKNAASVLLLGALAPLSARLRVRLHERWRVLVWQLSGRPPDRGLAAL